MPIELDHVFVAVKRGAPEMADLLLAGFGAEEVHEHPGQGTASTGLFFENMYVEFIWLVDPDAAGSAAIRRTGLLERLTPAEKASPFGCGLRGRGVVDQSLPFETWDYRPPYVPEGMSIPMGVNSECLAEPLLFFLPWKTGPGGQGPPHPNGARAITGVALDVEQSGNATPQLQAFTRLGLVEVNSGRSPLLRVELDDGKRGAVVDLRPDVPFVIRW